MHKPTARNSVGEAYRYIISWVVRVLGASSALCAGKPGLLKQLSLQRLGVVGLELGATATRIYHARDRVAGAPRRERPFFERNFGKDKR